MNRYLVILDLPTGMAYVQNVAIILAENKEKAKDKFLGEGKLIKEARCNLMVYDLAEIEPDWYYFT